MRIRRIFTLLGILFASVTLTGVYIGMERTSVPSLSGTAVAPDILDLTFAGDIMAHDVNYNRPPYGRIYEDIRPVLQNDDLSFGNLEFPVDPGKPLSSYPAFNQHLPYVEAAVEAGFDIFSVSNNHTNDQGPASVIQTARSLDTLKESIWSGVRLHSDDPYHPVSIRYGNWHIGFLSISLFLNQTDGKELVHTLNIYNEERIEAFLRFLREVAGGYDLLILSVHGGVEYTQVPSTRKAQFFTRAAEAGADIIWGHHPHVLQPWDYFDYGGRRKLIIYSAGNLISGQTWYLDPQSPDPRLSLTGESALFRVQVIRKDDEAHVHEVTPEFIFNYRDGPMVIRKAELLLGDPDISIPWRTYYSERFTHLQKFASPAGGAYLDGGDESR